MGKTLVGLSDTEIVRKGIGRAFQVAKLLNHSRSKIAAGGVAVDDGTIVANAWSISLGPRPTTQPSAVMEQLGLASEGRTLISGNLSHGDQKLLDMALALVLEPKVLLLDRTRCRMRSRGTGADDRDGACALEEGGLDRCPDRTRYGCRFFSISQTIHVLCYGKLLAQGNADANPQ
jgi:branched-chain amino acid transport system ATP-binding protein